MLESLTPSARKKLIIAATAVAGVAVGATVVAFGLGAFKSAPPVLKPARTGPRPTKPPRPAPLPDDAPLEAWEEEAEAAGDVSDDHDKLLESDAEPVGKGSPDEHCFGVAVAFGPDGTPLVGGGEEFECVSDPLGDPRFAPVDRGAPMAAVPANSTWPLRTRHRRRLVTSYFTQEGVRGSSGRTFASQRFTEEGVERSHVGVDLFAGENDVVLAPEAGRVIAVLPFHLGTWAIYLRTKQNQIVNLGEVKAYSWREFGVHPGLEVVMGQALARVGVMGDDSTMLHTEIYDASDLPDEEVVRKIRAGEYQWFAGEKAPEGVRDPSAYLVMAGTYTHRRESLDA